MSAFDFLEDAEGVHYVNPTSKTWTLCGLVINGHVNGPKPTRKRMVTCPDCSKHIWGLRMVYVKKVKPDDKG